MTQHEFGSAAWTGEIHAIIRTLMASADLAGVEYSSSEEYTNPPPHIGNGGRAGWHLIVSKGKLTLGNGPLDTAERRITADYETIKPIAAIPYEGNPGGEAEVRALAQAAHAKGLLSVAGSTRTASSIFPQLAPLHDMVAHMTAR